MSHLLSTLSCCWFWLIAGVLIGWLLNRWLCRCCCKPTTPPSVSAPPPQTSALLDSPPAANATNAAVTTAKPPAKATPKATKPKIPAKAKPAAPKVSFDLAAAKAAGFAIKKADDLTVIEGIGPKINDLFKENGVQTFAQLAKQTVPQMRAILDKGGARYRMANPATWAQQSALAADNKWAALKTLQDELSGGIKK
ncbi:hypothetical protein [Methylotenera sp. N17]|uniref:hypothetical protein n=1 Tax=Methylotenera sp. N17 TaxID=1502761 RepID=UPI000647CFFD|nr:hypothetical protein [Methylotenera sp. N17]